MSKITFVLTKADVLHPSPWVIVDMGTYASIAPSRTTQEIFFEKEKYYQEKFIMCNVVIMDTQRRKVFDLADGIFLVSKRTRLF